MDFFIGLDIGTSAIKGALMSKEGAVVKTVSGGYNYYSKKNKKLLDPKDFIHVCFSVIRSLADAAGNDGNVLAVCACCASGNLILLGKDDQPLTPIVGWQTVIAEEDINAFFTKEEQDAFYPTVGWPLLPQFPVTYLAAIRLHEPHLLDNAKTVAMSAEYLNFSLTGKWGISPSMGTPSYLMDQAKGEYNRALLAKLGISESSLPPIRDKGAVLGTLLPQIAKQLHLSSQTKVILGSFDHPSGAMGSGVFDEGEMLLSCGTSWVQFFPVRSREFAIATNGLVDRFLLHGAPYCVMKSITSVNEKIEALRLHYLGVISHREYDVFAQAAPLGCHGLRFHFTDEDYHISPSYTKSDIARAIIEGAAYILKENLVSLEQCGLRADKVTMIGGISNSRICVDIVSQILGKPIRVMNGQTAGAVGSCMLAGMGVGVYATEKDAFAVFERNK